MTALRRSRPAYLGGTWYLRSIWALHAHAASATASVSGAAAIPMIVSDGRRIMREDMSPVAAEGEYPMWHPSSEEVITRNKDKGHVCKFTCGYENRFAALSQEAFNNASAAV